MSVTVTTVTRPDLQDSDELEIKNNSVGSYQNQRFTLEEIKAMLFQDNAGLKLIKKICVADLTSLGDTGIDILTLPAGSVLRGFIMHIDETVVAGGTTVKVGLGVSGGDLDAYGLSASLAANQEVKAALATELASATTLAVSGLVTAGSGVGDTNISAGQVTVTVFYEEMGTLASS